MKSDTCNGCGHPTDESCKNYEFCKAAQQKKEARKRLATRATEAGAPGTTVLLGGTVVVTIPPADDPAFESKVHIELDEAEKLDKSTKLNEALIKIHEDKEAEKLIEHKVLPKKYEGLHPAFISLLLRLANPVYSIQECVQERLDWHHYGCPVYTMDKTRGQ